MKNLYTCNVKNLVLTEQSVLDFVSQNHLAGKSNNDVEVLQIHDQICDFLPRNVEKFFPNLRGLSILRTTLKTITRENLAPFPNLLFTYIAATKVEILDWDLYLSTPKVEFISFSESPVSSVGPSLLDSLKNLKEVHFSKCACIQKYVLTSAQIGEMRRALAVSCPPTLEMQQRAIFYHNDFFGKKLKYLVEHETAPLNEKIDQMSERIADLEKLIREGNTCSCQ